MGVTIQEDPRSTNKLRHYTITISNTHTISTTVTSHPGMARDWIYRTLYHHRRNRHRLVVGLGVQWNPHHNPASTIQLCIGRYCLIFHLHHSPTSPRILHRILFDTRITFVGLWCHSDSRKLLESNHQLAMVAGMPIDLRTFVVGTLGRALHSASVAEIALEVLGIDIERVSGVGRGDWEVDELSVDQVCYAAVDAFVAFAVGIRSQAWNFNSYL